MAMSHCFCRRLLTHNLTHPSIVRPVAGRLDEKSYKVATYVHRCCSTINAYIVQHAIWLVCMKHRDFAPVAVTRTAQLIVVS